MVDKKGEEVTVSPIAVKFLEKWSDKVLDSEISFNLLMSSAENDFTGMLEKVDDSYVSEFVRDIYKLLKSLGKVNGIKGMRLPALVDDVDASKSIFKSTKDGNLPANTLMVITDITGFKRGSWNDYGKRCMEFMFERLSSIVDDRYCIVVGTADELNDFLDKDKRLMFTFGQHKMKLAPVDIGPVYAHYLECLGSGLAEKADAEFAKSFHDFVRTNADDLPFRGRELADYLAKYSNARGELLLPRSRHEGSSTQDRLDGLIGLEHVKATIEEL